MPYAGWIYPDKFFTASAHIKNSSGLVSLKPTFPTAPQGRGFVPADGVDLAGVAFSLTGRSPVLDRVDALHSDRTMNDALIRPSVQVRADAAVDPTPITASNDTDDLFSNELGAVLLTTPTVR